MHVLNVGLQHHVPHKRMLQLIMNNTTEPTCAYHKTIITSVHLVSRDTIPVTSLQLYHTLLSDPIDKVSYYSSSLTLFPKHSFVVVVSQYIPTLIIQYYASTLLLKSSSQTASHLRIFHFLQSWQTLNYYRLNATTNWHHLFWGHIFMFQKFSKS